MAGFNFQEWDALEALRGTNPGGEHGDGWPDQRPVGINEEAWHVAVGTRRQHALAMQSRANKRAIANR